MTNSSDYLQKSLKSVEHISWPMEGGRLAGKESCPLFVSKLGSTSSTHFSRMSLCSCSESHVVAYHHEMRVLSAQPTKYLFSALDMNEGCSWEQLRKPWRDSPRKQLPSQRVVGDLVCETVSAPVISGKPGLIQSQLWSVEVLLNGLWIVIWGCMEGADPMLSHWSNKMQ